MTLKPGLAVQLRYQSTSKDLGSDLDRQGTTRVEARRIRPYAKGTLFSPDLRYYFHLNTSHGAIELMDILLDYEILPCVQVRAGQFKIPFTRYRIQSWQRLTFPDWAITSTFFGAERQMGLVVHNGYEKPAPWEYELGVFTGDNARASHGVGLDRVFGETPENPSDLANPGPRAGAHPELVGHLAYHTPGMDTASDTDFTGGAPRISGGASIAWDLDPQEEKDFSLRLAPEVLLKGYGASLCGVFYLGFVRSGDGLADQQQGMMGGLIQASYLFWARRLEVSARYAVVSFDGELLDRARARAEGLIAAAADDTSAQELRDRYSKVGQINQEQELNLGLNVYFFGHNLKWQNDFSGLVHSLEETQRVDLRVRSQLQMAF